MSSKLSAVIDGLKQRVQEREVKIRKTAAELIPLIWEQAVDLHKLRKKARKNWQMVLDDIDMDRRVADRYVKIAEEWAKPSKKPEAEMFDRLPYDLLKLEWLCRLPAADLKALSDEMDLVKTDCGSIVKEVKLLLGEKVEVKVVTIKAVLKSWEGFRDRVLTDLGDLSAEDRQKFMDSLEATLEPFKAEIRQIGEDEDTEEEGTEDQQDVQNETGELGKDTGGDGEEVRDQGGETDEDADNDDTDTDQEGVDEEPQPMPAQQEPKQSGKDDDRIVGRKVRKAPQLSK